MLMLDTSITIVSPSSRSQYKIAKQKRFKLTPERKLWPQWSEFVRKTVPQVSVCDWKCTIANGNESRWPNDENRLQLNSDKTKVLWCTTGWRKHPLLTTALSIDGVPVFPETIGCRRRRDCTSTTQVKSVERWRKVLMCAEHSRPEMTLAAALSLFGAAEHSRPEMTLAAALSLFGAICHNVIRKRWKVKKRI